MKTRIEPPMELSKPLDELQVASANNLDGACSQGCESGSANVAEQHRRLWLHTGS